MQLLTDIEVTALASTSTVPSFASVLEATDESVRNLELDLANAQRAHDESDTGRALAVANANLAVAQAAKKAAYESMLDLFTTYGVDRLDTPTHRIRVAETPGAVVIHDEARLKELRPDLFKVKETVTADKKAIGDAIVRKDMPASLAELVKTRSIKVTTLTE
jgi:hypothetical protein